MAMIRIDALGNLAQVSIAVHLAYTFFDAIHSQPFKQLSDQIGLVDHYIDSRGTVSDKKMEFKEQLDVLKSEIEILKIDAEPTLRRLKLISIAVAFIGIFIIVYTIFCPEMLISSAITALVCGLLCLPMPLLLLFSWIKLRARIRVLSNEANELNKSIIKKRVGFSV
ncbi:MAG: hypothetical protein C5B53_06760 [Candidatus Melainabacteria bacterium]|nr:MAG: hypothetical protein C5B53_06760 [Candidatus Melainabacteria bacterium]